MKFDNINYAYTGVNFEYGTPAYPDIKLNNFFLNKSEETLFQMVANGNSTLPYEDLEKKLIEKLGSPFYIFEASKKCREFYFCDEKTFFVKVSKDKSSANPEGYDVRLFSTDEKLAREIIEMFKAFFQEQESDSVYVISTNNESLSLNNLGKLKYTFIRDNYEERVLKGFDYVVSEYNKANPSGRITICNGPPGTGKTNLIKGMISEIKNSTIILLPAKFVVELDSPSIVSLLIEERSDRYGSLKQGDSGHTPILFIIEDADDCLVPRDGQNMSTISSLLNYTDGIFGSMLDLRIIATTNAEHMDFDKALLRPGRLCRHIVVEALSPEKAESVHKRLANGKEFKYDKKTTLAQVYANIKGGFEDAETDKKILGFQG